MPSPAIAFSGLFWERAIMVMTFQLSPIRSLPPAPLPRVGGFRARFPRARDRRPFRWAGDPSRAGGMASLVDTVLHEKEPVGKEMSARGSPIRVRLDALLVPWSAKTGW